MKLALISDLHGNLQALQAVLDDADRREVDEIICLGDTAALGPRPVQTLDLLQSRNIRCIMGNHDSFVLDPELLNTYSEAPPIVASLAWCRQRLSARNMDFVRTFVAGLDVRLSPSVLVALYHGTPRSNMEDLLCDTPPDTVDEMLRGRQAQMYAGGHTHIQMLRQHRGKLIVNTGSLGMPFFEYVHGGVPTLLAHAEYAILSANESGADVQLLRVNYDVQGFIDDMISTDHPLVDGVSALRPS